MILGVVDIYELYPASLRKKCSAAVPAGAGMLYSHAQQLPCSVV